MSRVNLVDIIPDPESVLAELGQLVRRRALLKSLLKLAKQKRVAEQQERLQAAEGQGVRCGG